MFITVDSARIFSVSFGKPDAPALLAIGGWIGNWELWAEPFSILSRDWHVIGYDHRGAGATIAPVESISHDRLVDDVFAVLDAYGIEQCVLAAESAGALTALGAALRQPQRIRGLVIVDGAYYSPGPLDDTPFARGLRDAYANTLDYFVDLCVTEPNSEHIKRWGRQILSRASQAAAIALYQMPSGVDIRPDIPAIAQPTLVLHGENDRIVTLEESTWLANALRNARLAVIPGAGHVPTVTFPAEIAREINAAFGPRGSIVNGV